MNKYIQSYYIKLGAIQKIIDVTFILESIRINEHRLLLSSKDKSNVSTLGQLENNNLITPIDRYSFSFNAIIDGLLYGTKIDIMIYDLKWVISKGNYMNH